MKKSFLLLLAFVFVATSCIKQVRSDVPVKVSAKAQWVQELAKKNPLKDSTNITGVYFRFNTIVNDFEVIGVFYPTYKQEHGWDDEENGVYLIFHSLKPAKNIVLQHGMLHVDVFHRIS